MPDGHGKSANLRGGDFLNWTNADIVEALTSGFTPSGDVLGAGMTAVVRNLAELPESDRQAIAVYLKSLPPLGPARARQALGRKPRSRIAQRRPCTMWHASKVDGLGSLCVRLENGFMAMRHRAGDRTFLEPSARLPPGHALVIAGSTLRVTAS